MAMAENTIGVYLRSLHKFYHIFKSLIKCEGKETNAGVYNIHSVIQTNIPRG